MLVNYRYGIKYKYLTCVLTQNKIIVWIPRRRGNYRGAVVTKGVPPKAIAAAVFVKTIKIIEGR